MIGLELSWERLARMRRAGVRPRRWRRSLVCGGALAAAARLWGGLGPAPPSLLGAALAMSSTAIVIPVLAERRRLNRAAGRAAFSVLLLQDLMVAPLLFLISFLGDPQAAERGAEGAARLSAGARGDGGAHRRPAGCCCGRCSVWWPRRSRSSCSWRPACW